ncbi:MAG: DEAD/DEAH box helicase [Nitrospiraceae bacterium]|nr:DEAD/DEAH box helicase [Nitrospiraceae bacterium]
MKMQELIRYDVPPAIIELWRTGESDVLLPLQELAVKRSGLFGDGNLLVQAPTSSGKTFIGEMAAIQAALRRKKVVYLVPLKALAEEKFREFREKYARYGLEVIVSTRDHREFDRQLEHGNFSIAVVVYEKLAQLLVRRPERLEEVGLIVADELEILSDPDRGAMAEILLTRILRAKRRLIGLSAVIGGADKLAEWMEAKLVAYERRPVELRFGVLHEGVFRYRTYNDHSEGEEQLVETHSESSWEVLTENVCAFAGRGEACLVFVKAKHESRRGAELLSRRIDAPAASKAIAALRELEPTRSRDCLIDTLNTGAGFHNADLSPDERAVVEEAFRAGEIKVMVSTSTLAVGMNLPAQNAFIAPDKWRYDNRLGMPWKTPILRAEYDNMGGRAGRYGAGHEFGRSILVATTPFDYETLWRRYVEGECEPIEPRLGQGALEDHVLRLVASKYCRTQDELVDFIESTLTGKWVWQQSLTLEESGFRVRAAVNRAVDAGVLVVHPNGRIEATPLGLAAAAKGISIATVLELEHWIGESETRTWSELDLMLAVTATRDGCMLQVTLTSREYEAAGYVDTLKQQTDHEDITADVPLNRIRNCTLMPFFEEVRAIKVALFLSDWIEHVPMCELEERFNTTAGQILSAADQVSWLVDAAAALAVASGAQPAFVERLRVLGERVQRGLQSDAIPLARSGVPGLTRNVVIDLVAHQLHTPSALAEAPPELLQGWLSPAQAHRLKKWALRKLEDAKTDTPPVSAEPPAPVLIVDDRHPGQMVLDGARIQLQEKQYRLIRVLAKAPGQCVPYETIYQAVWGDTIVEPNQMHFQKRKLLDGVRANLPDREDIIKTVPKRGFVLNLIPDQVTLRVAETPTAA